uniref:L1 transposable element RRM domain-containing protein n=1 Tax=Podarcis muralis TaxID=64176 RepID=A0A670INJ2_PODMU
MGENRMSHTGKKGTNGGTPGDRRGSKQEADFKTEILKMFAEIKQSQNNLEHKLEQVDNKIGKMDKKMDETVNEIKGQIKEVFRRTQLTEEGLKRTRLELKDMKRDKERIKVEVMDLNKAQEEMKDIIAMNELRQKEVNLRLRAVPEIQNENIKEKLIIELAEWMGISAEEMAKNVQNAFRMRVKTTRVKKFTGDCLITFKDKEMRNRILQRNREKRLNIGGNYIVIFKDIPIRLLKRRDSYKRLAQTLKKNKIEFRWEFPEGLSFTYRGKRHRLSSQEETGKFLRKYKELKVEANGAEGAEGGLPEEPGKEEGEEGGEGGSDEEVEEEEEEEPANL